MLKCFLVPAVGGQFIFPLAAGHGRQRRPEWANELQTMTSCTGFLCRARNCLKSNRSMPDLLRRQAMLSWFTARLSYLTVQTRGRCGGSGGGVGGVGEGGPNYIQIIWKGSRVMRILLCVYIYTTFSDLI